MSDNINDYATAAFRFYAKRGIKVEEHKTNEHKGTFANMELPELKDIKAVEETISELDSNTIKAVETIYFKDIDKELQREDIKHRVHMAALTISVSERSIYCNLRKARRLFAEKRGLRL